SYDWTNLQYFNDVKFEGANFTDAQFLRVGNDLVIKAFGTEDSVTFKNYLSDSDSYSRDFNFLFADKTLTTADVMNIVIPLNGYAQSMGLNVTDVLQWQQQLAAQPLLDFSVFKDHPLAFLQPQANERLVMVTGVKQPDALKQLQNEHIHFQQPITAMSQMFAEH
ncbi:hypothetical protein ACSRDH_19610, partial [Acinetobacter baumannii]